MRFLLLPFLLLIASPAHADYAVWADSKAGISLSYPDTWRQVSSFQPDDLLTIAAPSQGESTTCRVKAREERRFLMYPVRMSNSVQKLNVSQEFWREYLSQYENVNMQFVEDGTSFGRATGSLSTVSYAVKHPANGKVRSGILSAGVYRDRLYILECTTDPEHFVQMRPLFLSILKSVDMSKKVHELKEADYSDFRDYELEFRTHEGKYRQRY